MISRVPEFSMSSQTDLLPDEDLPAYQLSVIHISVSVWEDQDTLCSVSCQAVQSMMCIKMRLLWILVHVLDQSRFYSKTTLSIYCNRTVKNIILFADFLSSVTQFLKKMIYFIIRSNFFILKLTTNYTLFNYLTLTKVDQCF